MMNSSEFDYLIEDYLARLERALRVLAPSRRQQLLSEITQHLDESRARLAEESEAAIRDLLDRVGQPDDIAAEAMADEVPSMRRLPTRLITGGVAVVVAAAIAIPLALTTGGATNNGTHTTTTISTARLVTVPVVAGQPLPTAAQVLAGLGLVVQVSHQPSSIVAAGYVAGEAPSAGSQVVIGSTVILTVSAGPPPASS